MSSIVSENGKTSNSLDTIVPDSHSDYNRVVIHAPKQYLSDIIKDNAITFERGGVYHVVCPTGTGKSTHFAKLPDSVFVTSLSLTAVQLADAVGASIHAPTVETDVLVHEGGYYFPSDKVTTTYESLPFVLSCARERPIAYIILDERHNFWTAAYRSSSLLKALDAALRYKESHPETIIITLTGTADFTSCHPLFEGAITIEIKTPLRVPYVVVESEAKERIERCIALIRQRGGRHFFHLNDKKAGLDRFIATATANGIERDAILAVNADVKDALPSADFGAYRIIVATAVMQEGYSLYGDFEGVHIVSASPPSIMHQFSQRLRDVAPIVYWYTGQDEDETKKLKTYKEVLSYQNYQKRNLLTQARAMVAQINARISVGDCVSVSNKGAAVSSDLVIITYDEQENPIQASVNYVAIDCKAYMAGVGASSRAAIEEWLGAFGWERVEDVSYLATSYAIPADTADIQLAKDERLTQFHTLCDQIYADGYQQTAADVGKRRATIARGLKWKETATHCVETYALLQGDDRTWSNAVNVVRHCEGRTSAIGRCKRIIALHNEIGIIYKVVRDVFIGERLTGAESAALYLRCLLDVDVVGRGEHQKMLNRLQSADGNAKKHDGLIKKVLRKLDLVMSRESVRVAKGRLWHWSDTAYNALMAEIVTPNEGNSLKSSSFGVTENEETRQKKGDFFYLASELGGR